MNIDSKTVVKFVLANWVGLGLVMASTSTYAAPLVTMDGPFNKPEYFNTPQYAYSPLPEICTGVDTTIYGGSCLADSTPGTYTPNATPGTFAGGLHKFVNGLPRLSTAANNAKCSANPGVNGANDLGHCLLVATPDKTTFAAKQVQDKAGTFLNLPDTDYYSIELGEYSRTMHTDLTGFATPLRGYHQLGTPGNSTPNTEYQYLSPVILAAKGRPTRIKFKNSIQNEIPLPVDLSYFGAGSIDYNGTTATPATPQFASTKRANLHLHGGDTPWISDGTPHTWTTPTNDASTGTGPGYAKGLSFQNVPDMVTNGWLLASGCGQSTGANQCFTQSNTDGLATYYYPNGQTSRTMFYHDHTFGITRLNVYMGEAGAYLLADKTQEDAIAALGVPGYISVDATGTPGNYTNVQGVNVGASDIAHLIPLVIQDRTFVPDEGQAGGQLAAQDPTWPSPTNWNATTDYKGPTKYWQTANGSATNGWGKGSLWLPHIYVTNQLPMSVDTDYSGNPITPTTVAALGRWDYTPWMGVPMQVNNPPVACTTTAYPGKPFSCPAMNNPTAVPESFMDVIAVNGTVYPHLDVAPDAYRFKMLNAADDRFFNVGLYVAVTQDPIAAIVDATGMGAKADAIIGQGGTVTGFEVTDPGVGYTASPRVQLTDGTHTNAYAYVTLDSAGTVLNLIPDVAASGTGYAVNGLVTVVGDSTNVYGTYKISSGNCQASGQQNCSITGLSQTVPAIIAGLSPLTNPVTVRLNYGIEPAAYTQLINDGLVEAKGYATVDSTGAVIDVLPAPDALGANYVAGGTSCEDIDTKLVPLCTEVKQVYPTVMANTCSGTNAMLPDHIDNMGLVHVPDLALGRTGMASNCWPDSWPTDGGAHSGLVPDANYAGPPLVQIGNEGGVLPQAVVIPATPVNYNYNRKMATVLGITGGHALVLSPATRADIIADFHGFAPSTTDGLKTTVLILYNDNPAPAPLFDTRFDMYTGDPDQTGSGGAPSTLPGYGPNTRTLLQIRISGASGNSPIDVGSLTSTSTGIPAIFASTQDKIIVPQPTYPNGNGYTAKATVGTYDTVQLPNQDSGSIGGINVTLGGSYTTAPRVLIGGGVAPANGTLATATASLAPTEVASLTLGNAGSYANMPTVSITGGGGTGAVFTPNFVAKGVATATLTTPGSGYANNINSVSNLYDVASGINYTCTPNCATVAHGVTSITVNAGSAGSFAATPAITITGGGGTGATATAVMSTLGTIRTVTPGGGRVCGRTSGQALPVTFTATGATQATGTANLANGSITSVVVTNGGANFPATGIRANIQGCGTITNGLTYAFNKSIASVTVNTQGSGYTGNPTIGTNPASTPAAAFTATLSGYIAPLSTNQQNSIKAAIGTTYTSPTLQLRSATPVPAGQVPGTVTVAHTATAITGFTKVSGGSGYTSAPTVTITGGNPNATATATLPARAIGSFTVTNAGKGYTTVPLVSLCTANFTAGVCVSPATDGGGAGVAYFTPTIVDYKGIVEGFDPIWGSLNVELADSIPAPGTPTAQNFQVAAVMPFGYVDPPSEMVADGAVADWRIDHIGVDAHVVHFHLFNVQVVNYLDIAGQTYMPDSNQLGWNESLRTEPFTSVFVALRTKNVPIPWELPNSIRAMDPDAYIGMVNGPVGCINNPFALQALIGPVCVPFQQVDPTANAVNLTNALINFGAEYVYHCHLLSHEEHDMMRPISFAVAPKNAPTLSRAGNSTTTLTITDNSFNETDFIVERSTNGGTTWTQFGSVQTGTGTTTGQGVHGTTTIAAPRNNNANTIYRVTAANIVGCNASVPALANGSVPKTAPPACSDIFTGWPTLTALSPASNTLQ